MLRFKKDDMVVVIAGKDKGKKGKVLSVIPGSEKALVEGVNFVTKHMRRTQQDQKGGVIEKESPIHLSNIMLFCKRCNKPVRVGTSVLKDGSKTRNCKLCKELI